MGTASRFICVLSTGAALAAALSASAFSQGFDLRALFNPILPKQDSVSLPSDPEWSGDPPEPDEQTKRLRRARYLTTTAETFAGTCAAEEFFATLAEPF